MSKPKNYEVAREFGAEIRRRRLERGLSQQELGRRLGVGHTTVYSWETEARFPRLRSHEGLARELGFTDAEIADYVRRWNGEVTR